MQKIYNDADMYCKVCIKRHSTISRRMLIEIRRLYIQEIIALRLNTKSKQQIIDGLLADIRELEKKTRGIK